MPVIRDGGGLTKVSIDDFEYQTENVTFAYLAMINKLLGSYGAHTFTTNTSPAFPCLVTNDDFVDKAIVGVALFGSGGGFLLRWNDPRNFYTYMFVSTSTAWRVYFMKNVNDVLTDIINVAQPPNVAYNCYGTPCASISGSSIAVYVTYANYPVYTAPQPATTATDTSIASGKFGIGSTAIPPTREFIHLGASLIPPTSHGKKPVAVVVTELEEVEENGVKTLVPKGLHDAGVTYSAFDVRDDSDEVYYVVYDVDESKIEEIRQNVKQVIPIPDDRQKLDEMHEKMRPNTHLAGKHNWLFQATGHEAFEILGVADFYDGVVEGLYGEDPFKRVPRFELVRTVRRWMDKIKTVPQSLEKDSHERKLRRFAKEYGVI